MEKVQEKILFEVERNKSLMNSLATYLSRLQENIEIIQNNINILNKKSLELSMKRKDFDETLGIVAYDNNAVTQSFIKTRVYLDELAFCDLFLSLWNSQWFQK